MSTTELSRSMLESKDKDELHQIANAMGGKPGSRARKAEIVDLILDLAGVGGRSGGSSRSADPKPAQAEERSGAETGSAAAKTGADPAPNGDSAPRGDSTPNGASAPTSTPAPAAEAPASAESTSSADAAPSSSPAPQPNAAAARPQRQSSFSFDPMADARAEAAAKQARENGDFTDDDDAATTGGDSGEAGSAATAPATADADQPAEGAGESSGDRGQAQREHRRDDRQRDRQQDGQGKGNQQGGQQDNRQQGGQGNQQGGQGNQGNQQGGQGNQQHDDGEPGNRKRRRRGRNRDRDDQQGNQQGGGQQRDDWDGEPVEVSGYLDLRDDGYGFLRVKGFLPSKDDVYVSVKQARQYGLRKGDHLTGASRPAGRSEKNPALLRIDEVNGMKPDQAQRRPKFEDLTPLFPDQKLKLERADDPTNMTARIIDLIAPIGKGQRGLIVSPPKAGKTTIMKEIARSIELNNPEVKVLVLLVDERPEEVTDMRRWLVRGDVIASTFDRPSDEHTMVAELTIERAKRMVEMGEDVVIILDGITRLARAYNLAAPATGRIMSGGVDSGALYPPKRFFGAARNVEEGGSLTILATALVETGSKMDEVIFEEFKGTGNMELRLDRRTAERRIYPAIDVDASSTRHEELLFERKQLQQVWKLRRVLSGMAADGANAPGLELLIDRLKTFNSNDEFLAEVARGPVG